MLWFWFYICGDELVAVISVQFTWSWSLLFDNCLHWWLMCIKQAVHVYRKIEACSRNRFGRREGMSITCSVCICSLSYAARKAHTPYYRRLFKVIVGVQLCSGNSAPNSGNNHHLTIPFEGGTHSFKRQGACVSRNWRYESEPPLKPSPLTCYKQFGTNSIILLMFLESRRVHI